MHKNGLQTRIAQVKEAQELIRQAAELVKSATEGDEEVMSIHKRVMAYVIPALELAVSDDHKWIGSAQYNCETVINELQALLNKAREMQVQGSISGRIILDADSSNIQEIDEPTGDK